MTPHLIISSAQLLFIACRDLYDSGIDLTGVMGNEVPTDTHAKKLEIG